MPENKQILKSEAFGATEMTMTISIMASNALLRGTAHNLGNLMRTDESVSANQVERRDLTIRPSGLIRLGALGRITTL